MIDIEEKIRKKGYSIIQCCETCEHSTIETTIEGRIIWICLWTPDPVRSDFVCDEWEPEPEEREFNVLYHRVY